MPINLTTPKIVQEPVSQVTASQVKIGRVIISPDRRIEVEIVDASEKYLITTLSFVTPLNTFNDVIGQLEAYVVSQGMIKGTKN